MLDISEQVEVLAFGLLALFSVLQVRINRHMRRENGALRDNITDLYRKTNRASALLLIQDAQIEMLKTRNEDQKDDSKSSENMTESEDEHKP